MPQKNKKNKLAQINIDEFLFRGLKLEEGKVFFSSNIKLKDFLGELNLTFDKVKKTIGLEKYDAELILTDDQIAELLLSNNFEFEKINSVEVDKLLSEIFSVSRNLKLKSKNDLEISKRQPIVTIMGHVDHGKTTLLDFIKKSKYVEKEFGNITQGIGAYQAVFKKNKITFIDTPGHEIFSQMRRCGSSITDIIVLVVSATEKLMPQAIESIELAKSYNVPLVVAINKIDLPNSNPKKIKTELSNNGVLIEDLGGDVQSIEISAKSGTNIDHLLESIILKSELMDLKAYSNIPGIGEIIETGIEKNQNIVSVILISGILKIGDSVLIDGEIERIRSIYDENNSQIKEIYPGQPGRILGIKSTPSIGEKFLVINDLKKYKKISESIKIKKNEANLDTKELTEDELFDNLLNKTEESKIINLIVKSNNLGSLNSIVNKINALEPEEAEINIIKYSVGEVTINDVNLSASTNSIIYTFSLEENNRIKKYVKEKSVLVMNYNVIYELFDDIELRIKKMSTPKLKEEKIGEVEVRKIFESSKLGKIAGSYVKKGMVKRNAIAVINRSGEEIFKSRINTLKSFKEDVKLVAQNKECGITVKDFNDFKENDMIFVFDEVEST